MRFINGLSVMVIGLIGLTTFIDCKTAKAEKDYLESADCAIEQFNKLLTKMCGKTVEINIFSLVDILGKCGINGDDTGKLSDLKLKTALKCILPQLLDGLNADCGKVINLEKLFDQAERPLKNKCGIVQKTIDLVKATSFCVL